MKAKIDPGPEFAFDHAKAERGIFREELKEEGTTVGVLEPDVSRVFHDSASASEAPRTLLKKRGK